MSQKSNQAQLPDGILKAAAQAFDSHGYGLQYAAMKTAKDSFLNRQTWWRVVAAEYPVATSRHNTHIDILLESDDKSFLLAVECKRVNPKFGTWLFARAPVRNTNRDSDWIFADYVRLKERPARAFGCYSQHVPSSSFHIATALARSDKESEQWIPGDRGDIARATDQISVGVNGLVEHLARRHTGTTADSGPRERIVLGVILTTAEIFSTDVDLSRTDLVTGSIDANSFQLESQKWVFYQHNVSAVLTHSLQNPNRGLRDLAFELDSEFARTIVIVSSSHWLAFLKWFSADVLRPVKLIEEDSF